MLKALISFVFILFCTAGCHGPEAKPAVLAGFEGASMALLDVYGVSYDKDDRKFRDRIACLRRQYDCTDDPKDRRNLRNRIMTSILLAIMNYHDGTADDLYETTSTLETLFDWTSIGLSGSVPLVGAESSKNLLGVLSAMVTGSRKALEANILAENSKFAVLINQRALRIDRLAGILKRMKKPDANYPLDVGLADLYQFYLAGSIRGSVTDLVRQSEESLQKSAKKLENALGKAPEPDTDQTQADPGKVKPDQPVGPEDAPGPINN